jgi:hypothetical protein
LLERILMIDINCEKLLHLVEVPKSIPGRPHISTVIRWWRHGVKGVRLETVVVGGRRYTSFEAVQRFISRLNNPSDESNVPLPKQRQKEIARADQRMDAEGLS